MVEQRRLFALQPLRWCASYSGKVATWFAPNRQVKDVKITNECHNFIITERFHVKISISVLVWVRSHQSFKILLPALPNFVETTILMWILSPCRATSPPLIEKRNPSTPTSVKPLCQLGMNCQENCSWMLWWLPLCGPLVPHQAPNGQPCSLQPIQGFIFSTHPWHIFEHLEMVDFLPWPLSIYFTLATHVYKESS